MFLEHRIRAVYVSDGLYKKKVLKGDDERWGELYPVLF